MSYLERHRPICAVIQDIRLLASERRDMVTVRLCDEAQDYAQRMSARLVEYKKKELEDEQAKREAADGSAD